MTGSATIEVASYYSSSLRHGAGRCRVPKNGFGMVFGGIKNPTLTPHAGRSNFGAPQNGAVRWQWPLWHPEKMALDGIWVTENHVLLWKKRPGPCIRIEIPAIALHAGRPQFGAPWHGAVHFGVQKKAALARYLGGPSLCC